MRRWSLLLVFVAGCGSSAGPAGPPDPVVPVAPQPVLTVITVQMDATEIAAGQTLVASIAARDDRGRPMTVGQVAWTSSDPAIARIGSDGVILGLDAGTVIIRAVVGEVAAERSLTIGPLPPGPVAVATVAIAPVAITMPVGETHTLQASLTDFAGRSLVGRDVTWSSSNDTIAVVSSDGTVTARTTGIVLIEAISETRRGTAQVTVTQVLDAGIAIAIPVPVPGTTVEDTIAVVATVRSVRAVSSVVAVIAGREYPMTFGQIPNTDKGPAWSVLADISTLAFGPHAVVVRATDSDGGISLLVVPFIRNPRVPGGNKNPPGSK